MKLININSGMSRRLYWGSLVVNNISMVYRVGIVAHFHVVIETHRVVVARIVQPVEIVVRGDIRLMVRGCIEDGWLLDENG